MFKSILIALSGAMLASAESQTVKTVGAGLVVVGITRVLDVADKEAS